MKSDLFRNNRKALAALLLCSGFIVGHPLTVYARNSETANVETPQQQVKISGTVNDAMGPIIGASIVEKGNSRNGTITDMNGKFSLSVKPGAVLVISYIGYKEILSVALAGKLIVKFPSMSVIVPLVVFPFSNTVAPIIGSPAVLVTLPVIFLVCWTVVVTSFLLVR